MSTQKAEVIQIGNRYFCGFGKKRQVMTAWSLAGAELFLPDGRINETFEKLKSKGKKPVVRAVFLAGPDAGEVSQ